MNKWDDVALTANQKDLLREFLLTILPPLPKRVRNNNNELSTIAKALDRWFMRYYKFHVGLTALGEVFEALREEGYTMRAMGPVDDPETKKTKAGPLNDNYRGEAPYRKLVAYFIHVNVHPTRVRMIRSLTYASPENTGVNKLIDRGAIEDELRTFRVAHLLE